MPKKSYTREFKLKVVQSVETGELRPAQACREYQLAESVLTRWRHEVRLRGDAAFTPLDGPTVTPDYEQRIAELERVCGQLAVENAALKKALQLAQSKRGTSS
jgi:transposase